MLHVYLNGYNYILHLIISEVTSLNFNTTISVPNSLYFFKLNFEPKTSIIAKYIMYYLYLCDGISDFKESI